MKHFFLTLLLTGISISSIFADPSIYTVRDTITDNDIILPEFIDLETKDLMTNWYLQRYIVLDSMAKRPNIAVVSDAEYISRLQKLPTVIEMPYNSIVRQYIELYAAKKTDLVERMLSLGLYYNPIFEDALEKYQLPQELKYLPIIESALNPNAVSRAGAAGLWQFMASTAAGEGLEVNSLVDERRDPIKSSEAAASLLKKYYDIFNDWTLTLAAYNCGPGNVAKAIKNSGGKQDFWEIYSYLPKETRGYVPAFIAATYIMHNFGYHGIAPAVARSPIVTDTVHVNNRVHFKQISDVMGLSVEELRILNPQYRQDIIPGHIKPYALILPSVQAYCYKVNEDSILYHDQKQYAVRTTVEPASSNSAASQSVQSAESSSAVITGSDSHGTYIDEPIVKYHTVQRGESLKSIAQQYGVSVESIRESNNLSSAKINRGKKLKINTYARTYITESTQKADTTTVKADNQVAEVQSASASTQAKESKPTPKPKQTTTKAKAKTYAVKSGDTLERIASKNGITVAQLKTANNLKSDMIHPGQKLTIPAAKASSGKKTSTSSKKSTSKRRR